MKKAILLSTALTFMGSAAFAEVKVGGEAEAGYLGGDVAAEGFVTDMDLTFTADTATDTGVSFGAEAELGGAEFDEVDTKFWAKGDFGTVWVGDVDGAMDATVADAFAGSSIGDVAEKHDGAFKNWADEAAGEAPTLRYDYARDAFEVSASFQKGDADQDDGFAVAAAYNFDAGMADFRVAAATQKATAADGTEADVMGGSVEADLKNGWNATVSYADQKVGAAEGTNMGVAVGYTVDRLALAANYGQNDWKDGEKSDGYGATAAYDLGSGVTAKAGYGASDEDKAFSLGLGMKF